MSYYPSSCPTFIPHDPNPCEEREYARVRSAGFIQIGFNFTTTSSTPDPTDTQEWLNGISSGQIIVIPETNGEVPKGSPVIGPRYGLHAGAVLGYDFEATYEDPNYNSNCGFYNQLVGNLNYSFFYRTSTNVYLTDTVATIIPNRIVKNDLTEDVVWEVQVRWISNQFPCGIAVPESVFDYAPYYYAPPVKGSGDGGAVLGNTNYNYFGGAGVSLSGTKTLEAGTTTFTGIIGSFTEKQYVGGGTTEFGNVEFTRTGDTGGGDAG